MSSGSSERPLDAVEERVLAVLDRLGVPYERMPIDPDYADTGPFCEKYGVPLEQSANTIIVASKKEPVRQAAWVVEGARAREVIHEVRRLRGVSRSVLASSEVAVRRSSM